MKLAAFSKLVRRSHMYLALFLTPWMALYAISTLVMNHHLPPGSKGPPFIKESERTYTNSFAATITDRDAAAQILRDLNLEGTFNSQGSLKQGRLVIVRNSPTALRRITYTAADQKVTIEREEFRARPILRRMHTRSGFTQPYASAKAWGLTVDLVVIAMVFWVGSGVWLWWEIRPARKTGAVFMLIGIAMFGIFMATL